MKGLTTIAVLLSSGLFGCALPAPLRVMTFNIRYGLAPDGRDRWDLRRQRVIQTIRANDPDVIGVQEALEFQVRELADAFGRDYAFVGVGRDDGASQGEFVPIFFRKSRFQLVRGGHFWLSETPDQPGSRGWDAALPRMATWVQLRFQDSPQNLVEIINTHFDHRGEEARLESARLLRRTVEAQAGNPIIVLGDFNAAVGSDPYLALTGDSGNLAHLSDAYAVATDRAAAGATRAADQGAGTAETGTGTFNGFRGDSSSARIDWILHNRRFETLDAQIDRRDFDGRYPSDHFPVTATLRLLPATRFASM